MAEHYWYNLKTGEVEYGRLSPAVDRAGPFEARRPRYSRPAIMEQRAKAWEEDEKREDEWDQ